MQSTILFIGDCPIGCLRSIRFMIVCLDCASSEEITTITDQAREMLVPVLLI